MIHNYQSVLGRLTEVVESDPHYVYDEGLVFGAKSESDGMAECRYYDPIPLVDGEEPPTGFDDDDLLALIMDASWRVTYRRGRPSCLIAQVLDPWLSTDQREYVFKTYNTESITNGLWGWLVREHVLENDILILALLRGAQEAQDRKDQWIDCLAQGRELVASGIEHTVAEMEIQIAELHAGKPL